MGWLKTITMIYFAHKFVIGPGLAVKPSLCSTQCQLGGLDDLLPRWHLHGWQVVAAWWLGAQLGLGAAGLGSSPCGLGFLQCGDWVSSTSIPRERARWAFYDLISEVK